MAENIGDRCGWSSQGRKCEKPAYNPVKVLKDPVVTPDGKWHWRLDGIKFACEDHARVFRNF